VSQIPQKTIVTPHGAVEYADIGHGPAIVYFHGFGIGNQRIVEIEAGLIEAGFRLIVPNRPGYYNTPLDGRTASADCTDLVADLLDVLQIESTAIIGSSGGGFYASGFAARHPNRTSCLVLECSNTHPWTSPGWLPQNSRWTRPLLIRPWLRKCLLWSFRQQLRFAAPQAHLKQAAGLRHAEVEGDAEAIEFCQLLDAMRHCLRHQPAGFENDFVVLVNELGIENQTIDCPVLVVHDRFDPVAPIENVHWAMQRMPQAEWLDVHTAGHLIWLGRDAERVRHRRLEFLHAHADASVDRS